MKTETKFDIGDNVFFVEHATSGRLLFRVREEAVHEIKIIKTRNCQHQIIYSTEMTFDEEWIEEEFLFKTHLEAQVLRDRLIKEEEEEM